MQLTRRHAILLIIGVLLIAAALVAIYLAYERWSPYDETDVERWIDDLGPWGPIAYIGFFAASMLFAPLPTAPAPIIAATVFGGGLGFLYTMIGAAIGSAVCFWVSRTLGRRALRRLMSQAAVDKIDELGERLGIRLLIVLRLFPIAGVDYVSYAAGLTRMRFLPYMAISILASAPILALAAVLGEGVRSNWVVAAAALAAIALFFIAPLSWLAWKRGRDQHRLAAVVAAPETPPSPITAAPTLPLDDQ